MEYSEVCESPTCGSCNRMDSDEFDYTNGEGRIINYVGDYAIVSSFTTDTIGAAMAFLSREKFDFFVTHVIQVGEVSLLDAITQAESDSEIAAMLIERIPAKDSFDMTKNHMEVVQDYADV